MRSMKKSMVVDSERSNFAFLGQSQNDVLVRRGEELACFVPGMLTLGALQVDQVFLSKDERQSYLRLAEKLAATCHEVYVGNGRTGGPCENYSFGSQSEESEK